MKLTLECPITRDDHTISTVRLFVPRAGDMVRVAIAETETGGELTATLRTIERLTDLPNWAVDELKHNDLMAIGAACDALFDDRGMH